ncbi:MAG TPA: hypothetical protein PK344_16000 [Syntrophorhabdaceae bacterium]|nr:hypothetical protein [Syntrophorhabdaceae bacterium]
MNRTLIFPAIIIGLSLGASVVYALEGDYYHARYWFLAAALNASVTF